MRYVVVNKIIGFLIVFGNYNMDIVGDQVFIRYARTWPVEMVEKGENILDKLTELFSPPITSKDLVIFARQLSTLVSAGVPLVQGLSILEEQIENSRLLMEPQAFAEKALNAVKKNKAIIVIPGWYRFFWLLHRFFPETAIELSRISYNLEIKRAQKLG